MSSIKCPQCGLVNFSTALQCKRCQHQFAEYAAIAAQRPYQTNVQEASAFPKPSVNENQPASFQSYQVPPPPPTFHDGQARQDYEHPPAMPLCCVKCGGRRGVNLQNFKKDYVPPVAYLGVFLGLLPMLILVLILRVSHPLTAPFCGECWSKFRKVNMVEALSSAGFFVLFLGAIFGALALESAFVFFALFAFSIGLIVWGHIFKKNHSPKFKKIDRKQVVIDDPTFGEVCFQR